jgi:hypothetical protein
LETGLSVYEATKNPFIAAGAAVVSLFSHHDNPAAMPDKYDTARFTQYVGELTGSAGTAYGPAYNGATDQMQQALGGKSMLQYIQDWAKDHLNSSNAQEKALAQQYAAQFGTTGGGKLTFGHDIGQESVVGGNLSGTYVSIHDAASDATQQILNLADASAQAALQQQESADRLAASFTSLILGGPSGFSIPALIDGMQGSGGGSIPSPIDARRGYGSEPRQMNPIMPAVTVRVLEGATVGDATGVIAALNDNIPVIANRIAQINYQKQRMYSGYVSVTN